jgi:hypothetical protein
VHFGAQPQRYRIAHGTAHTTYQRACDRVYTHAKGLVCASVCLYLYVFIYMFMYYFSCQVCQCTSKTIMPSKGKGADKVDDLETRVAKAAQLKKKAKKRKAVRGEDDKAEKDTKVRPDVSRYTKDRTKDKKTENFKGYAKLNADKQRVKKSGMAQRLKQKAMELKAKKAEEDSDEDEDNSDDAEEDVSEGNSGEVEGGEIDGEAEDDEGDGSEEDGAETIEELKKKFQGKRVLSKEEQEEELAREQRLDEVVQKRAANVQAHIERRQVKQKKKRTSKRRRLKGNQATRVGDNYMPFLSTGF